MIVMHNFKEAYQLYQLKRIPYRLIQDQAFVLIGMGTTKHPTVNDALDITQQHIDWLLQQPEASMDYLDYLGGYMHVAETEADLLAIEGCDFDFADQHGRWPNVTDIPLGWDACNHLDEANGEPYWTVFLLCTSDTGGNLYFVPKHLWKAARVEEHLAATNKVWA